MPEWLKAVILGVVEGLTEFLPISSTGHLIVAGDVLGLQTDIGATFEIFIQIGAVFAVIGYYWSDLFTQLRTILKDTSVQQLWLRIFLAFIPAAVIGVLFDDQIEAFLFSSLTVGITLIVGGVMFIVVERYYVPRVQSNAETLSAVSWVQAFVIGVVQCLALIPGMSRSGMSIIGGMLAGLNRQTATQFSFYLAIPTLGGAAVYSLLGSLDELSAGNAGLLAIGTVVSGIVAWFSIGWLLRYVSSNTFIPFGYYRIVVGVVILIFVWF